MDGVHHVDRHCRATNADACHQPGHRYRPEKTLPVLAWLFCAFDIGAHCFGCCHLGPDGKLTLLLTSKRRKWHKGVPNGCRLQLYHVHRHSQRPSWFDTSPAFKRCAMGLKSRSSLNGLKGKLINFNSPQKTPQTRSKHSAKTEQKAQITFDA